MMEESSQYFSEQPSGTEVRRAISAQIWGRELTLLTASGVFAADWLDRGTAVLLRTSPIPQGSPRILDLGCGYGPIALAIALHCPGAVIDAVDVNERALALCRENAEALGVADRVQVLRPEQVEPDVRYDEIWSNPPIRIGKQSLHELLLSWLARLAPDGVARLVVGKNLGSDTLQRWLIEQGYSCERVASAKGFRVLVVRSADQARVSG
ncbi:MAG TPA: methyltransferase [Propionibacteriaceae bacterium]|nr:methyltransferase [Propionibacteriaceae bacterium]